MSRMKLLLVLGLCTGCASSGALGPNGYKQAKVNYEVTYSDPANQRFLPEDWALDNFVYDSAKSSWSEKKGNEYRAVRELDEDGDGTIEPSETKKENIYDLRFVNTRDSAVIWVKVHPLTPSTAKRDLDVVFDSYANGLEGTGLFEQSTLFGIEHDKARHFTTFVVDKRAVWLGPLACVRGTVEIADVEKLRLNAAHRDTKSTLLFAHVVYDEPLYGSQPAGAEWPVTREPESKHKVLKRTGLLVAGYYADAKRFDAHVGEFESFLTHIVIPPGAVPDANGLPALAGPSAAPVEAGTPAAPPSTEPVAPASTALPPAPAAPAPAPAPSMPAPAVPAPTTPPAATKPVATVPATKAAPAAASATTAPVATPAAKK